MAQKWRIKTLYGNVSHVITPLIKLLLLYCLAKAIHWITDDCMLQNTVSSLSLLTGKNGNSLKEKWTSSEISELYKMSPEELKPFFKYKEEQYRSRQNQITNYCKSLNATYPLPLEDNIFQFCHNYYYRKYEPKIKGFPKDEPGYVYCTVAKVASRTWISHFCKIANIRKTSPRVKLIRSANIHPRNLACQKPYVIPKVANDSSLLEIYQTSVSLMMSRHPFARIVSLYFNIYNEGDKANKPLKKDLFINMILSRMNEYGDLMAQHWIPQSDTCPICSMNYTILGHFEELEEDTAYFLLKNGLQSKINIRLHENKSFLSKNATAAAPSGGDQDPYLKDRSFWRDIGHSTILKMYQAWKKDFIFFGYDPNQYFKDIGLDKEFIQT